MYKSLLLKLDYCLFVCVYQGRRKLVRSGTALNCDDNHDDRRVKKIYITVNLKCSQPLPSSHIYYDYGVY